MESRLLHSGLSGLSNSKLQESPKKPRPYMRNLFKEIKVRKENNFNGQENLNKAEHQKGRHFKR